MKVAISGSGTLDALRLPDQKEWSDFKLYPPNMKIDSNDLVPSDELIEVVKKYN